MNTNTYDIDEKQEIPAGQGIPAFIPLGIAMDYQVKWNVHRIIRDFVQNFYDSIGCDRFADEFRYQWGTGNENKEFVNMESSHCSRRDRFIHIKMSTCGHAFSYEWLTCIGGSTKTGKMGYAGEYGEGFKIALLCLVKLGGNAVMSSGRWELRPCEYTEKIDHRRICMFGYRMTEREDDGLTTLDIYGIPNSDENIRHVREALLEFFFPENALFGDIIEITDNYALYSRSDMAVPCSDGVKIQGVFYYKYIARGRLPFPAVIHLTEKCRNFESDRSREILTDATVVSAVYQLAVALSPKASFWMLMQMENQWNELPKFGKGEIADLDTWYYVICQLVRNISSESGLIEAFAKVHPVGNYAYLERFGSDIGRNRLLREAKNWFVQRNNSGNRRRLVNPIFRLVGVPAVLDEYIMKKDILYRMPDSKEQAYAELLKECVEMVFPQLLCQTELPEIILYVGDGMERKCNSAYMDFGVSAHVETRIERDFSVKGKNRHIKYRVKETVWEANELSAETKFQKAFLKYIDACVRMYGTEQSACTNAVLTNIGAVLYRSRDIIGEYAARWNAAGRDEDNVAKKETALEDG